MMTAHTIPVAHESMLLYAFISFHIFCLFIIRDTYNKYFQLKTVDSHLKNGFKLLTGLVGSFCAAL